MHDDTRRSTKPEPVRLEDIDWCKPIKRLLATGMSLWDATGRLARKSEAPKPVVRRKVA